MPAGRPNKKVDWKRFEAIVSKCPRAVLADIHVAGLMGMDLKTLIKATERKYGKKFSVIRKQKEHGVRQLLYQRLLEQSEKGNLGATIWLTKNLMGWSDKVEAKEKVKASVTSKTNMVFNVEFGDGTLNDT